MCPRCPHAYPHQLSLGSTATPLCGNCWKQQGAPGPSGRHLGRSKRSQIHKGVLWAWVLVGGPGLTCAGVFYAAYCVCHGSSCVVWCSAWPILGLKGLHAERQERGVHGSMHACIAMLDPMGQCCPEVSPACTDPALPRLAPCAFPCALFRHPDRAPCSSTPSSTPYSRRNRRVWQRRREGCAGCEDD